MSNDVLEKKPHRFMFDLNNFDEEDTEEEEFEEPPPPTFSEEELAAAKSQSFSEGEQKGRNDALQESAESREQFVALQLQVIAQNLPQIFEKEQEREKRYEAESVDLCLHLFEKLFPHLHEQFGNEHLKATVTEILKKQSDQKNVIIYVHTDARDGIEQHLEALIAQNPKMKLSVKADDAIQAGACRIDWDDGGAVKDPKTLANEIFEMLKDTLAASGTTSHDSVDEQCIEQQAEPAAQEASAESELEEATNEPLEDTNESKVETQIEEDQTEAHSPEDSVDETMEKPDE